MRRFALARDHAGQRDELLDAIHGAGAFRLFKATVSRLGLRERWFEYRDHAVEELAKDWLRENGIPFGE